MPYRLESQESVPEALRRSAREQLEAAISELADRSLVDPIRAVHDARKALKKERSLLRLGRAALDPAQRRAENHAFRQAVQQLGETRDADVMIQALDDLAERYAGQVPHPTFAAVRERLVGERGTARLGSSEDSSIEAVTEGLRAVALRIDEWQLQRDGRAAISDGLLRSYRRGSKAFRRAQSRPTVENLHAWRKRVKDLWYHHRWLEPISLHTMRGQAKDAHKLSELLGDDHDLAVLHDACRAIAGVLAVDLDPLFGLIEHRRGQLQTEAMFFGQRVYAEKPKAFMRRMHRYWEAWQGETRTQASHQPAELARATASVHPV